MRTRRRHTESRRVPHCVEIWLTGGTYAAALEAAEAEGLTRSDFYLAVLLAWRDDRRTRVQRGDSHAE